ncbi:glycerophosphodiester phosphodiesterase family protein [Gallaecimonas sp. GXIMD4217]|uniref:glycerophosphodiester phosphodiesterase n=1 Tax=Gallaecimonas sp. GXIMD4217 TaxID=3131927 RepID=UPI00311AD810
MVFKNLFRFVLLASTLVVGVAQAKTMVIGHRGAAGHAPENTLSSIQKALKLGVDAVEVDIRRSRDGALVAIHDRQVDRTTNGAGKVSEYTLAQLNTLDAGSWYGPQYLDEWIPTLTEVMNAVSHSDTRLIIELKVGGDGIEGEVLKHIRTHKMQDRVIIKSFDPAILERFSKLAPGLPRLYVMFGWSPRFNVLVDEEIRRVNPLDMDVDYIQVYHSFLGKDFIRRAHDRGMKVIAWGVHSRKAMGKVLALGVDGIETDYPDRLYAIMDEYKLKRMMVGYSH